MSFTFANIWIFLMIVCADTAQYSEDPLALNATEKFLLREISLIGGIPRDKWHALNHFTAPALPRQFHWLSQSSSLQHREWDINIYTMWSVKAKDIQDQTWYVEERETVCVISFYVFVIIYYSETSVQENRPKLYVCVDTSASSLWQYNQGNFCEWVEAYWAVTFVSSKTLFLMRLWGIFLPSLWQ